MADRVLEACKQAFERETAPVIVYGLTGAVGLALARLISEEIPVTVHAMVLPHPSEPGSGRGRTVENIEGELHVN